MGKHWFAEMLNVIGNDIIASIYKCIGARHFQKGKRSTRAGSHCHSAVLPGLKDDRGNVLGRQARASELDRNAGKVVFFAKHIDVMDQAEQTFADRGIGYVSIRGDQTRTARDKAIAAFQNDPEVSIAVCSLLAAGVGLNLQVASNLVLAELSWTDAEQTQAIDRIHRIGQSEPVTAWRIIAAQTIDAKIAELIDQKSGLAARALDGAGEQEGSASTDVQLEALVSLLTDALKADGLASI